MGDEWSQKRTLAADAVDDGNVLGRGAEPVVHGDDDLKEKVERWRVVVGKPKVEHLVVELGVVVQPATA